LIAALRYAGFSVEPMLLSTRNNGLVTELHPVLTEFDYVVAKLNLQDKVYLLDATNPSRPFGMLPMRCMNGKGRVLGDEQSSWYEIKTSEKRKSITNVTAAIDNEGNLTGTIQTTHQSYDAYDERQDFYEAGDADAYLADVKKSYQNLTVVEAEVANVDDISKPVVTKLNIEASLFDQSGAKNFLLNPFLKEKLGSNPFKSTERLFPVDYGVPIEQTYIFNLQCPDGFELSEPPQKVALALPNGGGRLLYDVQKNGNKLTVSYAFVIAKTVFSSDEYHYLKELYNRILAIQHEDLVFIKK
jgi:hypothetical protein